MMKHIILVVCLYSSLTLSEIIRGVMCGHPSEPNPDPEACHLPYVFNPKCGEHCCGADEHQRGASKVCCKSLAGRNWCCPAGHVCGHLDDLPHGGGCIPKYGKVCAFAVKHDNGESTRPTWCCPEADDPDTNEVYQCCAGGFCCLESESCCVIDWRNNTKKACCKKNEKCVDGGCVSDIKGLESGL